MTVHSLYTVRNQGKRKEMILETVNHLCQAVDRGALDRSLSESDPAYRVNVDKKFRRLSRINPAAFQ